MEKKKKISLFDLKGQFLEIWNKLIHLNASPHSIALGLAIGIFVGFLPIMGVQMVVVLFVAFPFRKANKVAAVSGVWITNPLTVIPIYMFIYWMGTFFYPKDGVLNYTVFSDKFTSILNEGSFIDKTREFFSLGTDIFVPMFIGGAVVGVIGAVITYFLTKSFVTAYRGEKLDLDNAPEERHEPRKHGRAWIEDEMPAPGVMELKKETRKIDK